MDMFQLPDPNDVEGVSLPAKISEFELCCAKDAVLARTEGDDFLAGQVWCHAMVSGTCYNVASCWNLQAIHKEHKCAEWAEVDNLFCRA